MESVKGGTRTRSRCAALIDQGPFLAMAAEQSGTHGRDLVMRSQMYRDLAEPDEKPRTRKGQLTKPM